MNTTIKCNFCDSVNHLVYNTADFAYECYNCCERHWLDENAKGEYMILNSLDEEEVEKELQDGKPMFALSRETPM